MFDVEDFAKSTLTLFIEFLKFTKRWRTKRDERQLDRLYNFVLSIIQRLRNEILWYNIYSYDRCDNNVESY